MFSAVCEWMRRVGGRVHMFACVCARSLNIEGGALLGEALLPPPRQVWVGKNTHTHKSVKLCVCARPQVVASPQVVVTSEAT